MHPPPTTAPQRSFAFENTVYAVIVPAGLFLLGWVWIGRAFLGAGGWLILLFAMTVVPVLFGALALTTAIAFSQRRPPSVGRITPRQAWAHVVLWVALFVFGFCVVDVGDAEDSSHSVLTLLVGPSDSVQDVSTVIALVAAVVAGAAWVWLLVELLVSGRDARRRRAAEVEQQQRQWQWQQWQWQQSQQPPPPAPWDPPRH
ncbi:hypothetical protein [Mumia sp. Pv 4-285]|uniref:hypothetical protein n=1 Tax=Mumia qirimensis TaxID=3234852 RepID=UPI00351CFCBF